MYQAKQLTLMILFTKNIYFGNKHTKVNELKKYWIHILYE